eukprot:UN16669
MYHAIMAQPRRQDLAHAQEILSPVQEVNIGDTSIMTKQINHLGTYSEACPDNYIGGPINISCVGAKITATGNCVYKCDPFKP